MTNRMTRCVGLTLAAWWALHLKPLPSHQRGNWHSGGRAPPQLMTWSRACVGVGPQSVGSHPRLLLPRTALNLWPFLLQSGETALHMAACYGYADVVQLLCSFGSNPNFQDKVGHGSGSPRFVLLWAGSQMVRLSPLELYPN